MGSQSLSALQQTHITHSRITMISTDDATVTVPGLTQFQETPHLDPQHFLLNLSSAPVSLPEDSSSTASSLVWIILFSILVFTSVIINTMFFVAVILASRRSTTHILIILFFLINLLEYGLLFWSSLWAPLSVFRTPPP